METGPGLAGKDRGATEKEGAAGEDEDMLAAGGGGGQAVGAGG